jgi:hypothetical protein
MATGELIRSSGQRPALLFTLMLAGLASFTSIAGLPQDGPHPIALLASLMPLVLVAMLWALKRPR